MTWDVTIHTKESSKEIFFQEGPKHPLHIGTANIPLAFLAFLLYPIHRILYSPGLLILEHIQKGFIQLGIGDYISHPEYHQAPTEKMTTVFSYKKLE